MKKVLKLNGGKILNYLETKFDLGKPSRQGWYAFDCPFHASGGGKNKMAANFEYQVVKCWACGYRSSAIDFIMELEEIDFKTASDIIDSRQSNAISSHALKREATITPSRLKMPTGFRSITEKSTAMAERARAYLINRGLDIDFADSLGFGYCDERADDPEDNYFGYIIIPFITCGELQYYIGRDFIGNFLRYKNPPQDKFDVGKADVLYNEDALLLRKIVFINEGCFDALTFRNYGVATLGWSMSDTQKEKLLDSNAETLVFVPDVGYYKEALRCAMPFMKHKKVFVLETDKLAQYGKDANEIGADKLIAAYKETKQLDFKLLMSKQ
jgi:DNA primase